MRIVLWRLAGLLLAGVSIYCVWIALCFGWAIFQIGRGNLGIAPWEWNESISVSWVLVAGTFLTVLLLSIGYLTGRVARECFRPGGLFRWNPRRAGRAPWWSATEGEGREDREGGPLPPS